MKLFRRYTTILWITFVVVVVFSIGLFSLAVYRRYVDTLSLMREAFRATAVAINHHAENVSDHARLIQGAAAAHLREPRAAGAPSDLFNALADVPGKDYYALDDVPHAWTGDAPNVTGKGSIKGRPPEYRREVEMTLALGPFFRQAKTNLEESACIYYVSAREFMAYYPWQPSREFGYMDSILKQEYYLGCLPDRNPQRQIFWTSVYQDQAGLGLMTTCAGPLYDGSRFMGAVAIDLTLGTLQQHVARFPYRAAQVFLLADDDVVLAHSAFPPPKTGSPRRLADVLPDGAAAETARLLRDEFALPRRAGGRLFFCERLPEAPWRLVFIARPRDVILSCLTESTVSLAILLGGLGLMLAITMRVTHTNFVAPARRMVEYIEEVGARPAAPVPDAPPEWQPWFEEISRVFREHARMMGELKEQNERLNVLVEELKQAMRERERLHAIESELHAARTIQVAILPRRRPPRTDLDLDACMEPAREVGGDFYDYFMIDDDRLAFVIGDVSGKGVPAALFMVLSRTLLKAQGLLGLSAAECVQRANVLLCGDNTAAMFVTLFYGILDLRTGELEYCNGGHNPPYLLRASGEVQATDLCGGPLLGVDEAAAFESRVIRLAPGEAIVLYTDGVTEAETAQQEFFTEARLEESLRANASAVASDLIQNVLASVRAFAAGAVQNDDITLLALRYRPAEQPAAAPAAPVLAAPAAAPSQSAEPLNLLLQNDLAEVERLHAALGEFCAREGVPDDALGRMRLAIEEVVVNIMRYAFEGAAVRPIRVKVTRHADRLEALIEDAGKAFNPLAVAAPDLTKSLDKRRAGGLGLHLVRSMVDDVDYCRTKVMNHVTLVINLPPAPPESAGPGS